MPTFLLPVALGLLQIPQAPPSAAPSEKLPLRIVYAGNVGTPYTDVWQRFLGEHTDGVKVVSASALQRSDLDGFDVLIVDGEVESRDEKGEPRLKNERVPLHLDQLQGFPVVLVGGQGGFLSDELRLKTSWSHG